MKLLHCRSCGDIFSLNRDYKTCFCTHTGGAYLADDITAEVHTINRHTAVMLGFTNSSFQREISNQMAYGDLPADMAYGGKIVSPGRTFKAFVIPESAPSVRWTYSK